MSGNNITTIVYSSTTIRFSLPEAGRVHVQIFDVLGREVESLVDGPMPAETYQLRWDASHCSSGIYFVRMRKGTSAS